MQHNCSDFRRVCEISDARFDNFDARFFNTCLNFTADTVSNYVAGTTQTTLVSHTVTGGVDAGSYVIGINTNYVTQCAIALQGEEFLVVINVEYCLCSVNNAPRNGNTDFNGVTETVVDLLTVVAQSHDFERDSLVFVSGVDCNLAVFFNSNACTLGRNVTALVELGVSRRVDRTAEGVYSVESLALESTNIFTEQCQYKCFLGLENTQTAERNPADTEYSH